MSIKSVLGAEASIYTRPTAGDVYAPHTNPVAHLDKVFFHSTFRYYELALAAIVTTVTHPALSPVAPTSYGQAPGTVYNMYMGQVVADVLLGTHGLGVEPKVLVATDGVELAAGMPIQVSAGAQRTVSAYTTTTQVWLRVIAYPGNAGMAAITKTYTTVVLHHPVSNPALPGSLLSAGRALLGHGKIDSLRKNLRRAKVGEAQYYLPLGRIADLSNGQVRWVLPDGSIYETAATEIHGTAIPYLGSFAGSASIGVRA